MSLLQKYRYSKQKRALNKRWKDGSVKALTHVAVPLTRLIPIKNIDTSGNYDRAETDNNIYGSVGIDDEDDETILQYTLKPHGNLTKGDGNGTREGDQVTAKTLYLRMTIRQHANAYTTNRPDLGRLLVYVDTQSNKSDWSTTSLFGTDGMFAANPTDNQKSISLFHQIDTRKRWIILHDQIIRENDAFLCQLQDVAATSSNDEMKVLAIVDLKIPINKKIFYDDTPAGTGSGVYSYVNKNAIYVTYLYMHDFFLVAGEPDREFRLRKIDFNTRLTYVDN